MLRSDTFSFIIQPDNADSVQKNFGMESTERFESRMSELAVKNIEIAQELN